MLLGRVAHIKIAEAAFVLASFAAVSWSFCILSPVHAASGAVNVKEQVTVPEAMLKKLDGLGPEAKERRILAQLGLQQFLRAILLGEKGLTESSSSSESKVAAWINQNFRSQFDTFVPSFNVKMIGTNQAEVKLVVSRQVVLAELEKAGLGNAAAQNSSATAAASSLGGAPAPAESSPAANIANTHLGVPFAAFLVDEKSHDVFVYPPEATPTQGNPGSFYHFKPANANNAKPNDFQLNSVDSPLADRAAAFSQFTALKLVGLKLHFDAAWARDVIKFLDNAAQLNQASAEARAWPPPVTFAASSLMAKQGVVAIFTVRSSDKSGAFEKFDALKFSQGHLVRAYWSRSIQDPAMNDKVPKILERMTAHFLKQVRSPKIENNEAVIRLIVDKKILEKDLTAVENILRTYVVGTDNILVPYEVTRADVRYFTPVVNTRIDRILDRIKKDVPTVHARAVPGEGGYLTLAPQNLIKQTE